MQSDNGKEFVNKAVHDLVKLTNIVQRTTTPYNHQANGLAERMVRTAKEKTLKMLNNDFSKWETMIPWIQFFINISISRTHNSSPFSLMFARINNQFTNYAYTQQVTMTQQELQARADHMHAVIFPQVARNMQSYHQEIADHYEKRRRILKEPFPRDSYVMTVPDVRDSKLEPRYEGPYKILRRTTGGTYQLLDADGHILARNYAPNQLKLISGTPEFAPTAEVKSIKEHEELPDGSKQYLTQWKNKDIPDMWVHYNDFQDTEIIRAYHDRLIKEQQRSKKHRATEPQQEAGTVAQHPHKRSGSEARGASKRRGGWCRKYLPT